MKNEESNDLLNCFQQFPLDQPMPYGLIKEIVNYRVKENIKIAEKKKN